MFGVSNVGVIPTKVPTAVAGQIVFNTSGTTNWTVPAGVTSICCVCVQANGNAAATTVTVNSVMVCRALNNNRIGDGGGNGGAGGRRLASRTGASPKGPSNKGHRRTARRIAFVNRKRNK